MVLDPTDLDTRFVNEADHTKAAHDALGLSHDSLSDITITGAQIEALLMFGSANAAWVPCIYELAYDNAQVRGSTYQITNVGGSDTNLMFRLPKPTNMGNLKLHVSGWQFDLSDADAGDKVNDIRVTAVDYNTAIAIDYDDTGWETADVHQETFTAVDCSATMAVVVYLRCTFTNANDFDLRNVALRCYYAAE